jgi:hypothetical protein
MRRCFAGVVGYNLIRLCGGINTSASRRGIEFRGGGNGCGEQLAAAAVVSAENIFRQLDMISTLRITPELLRQDAAEYRARAGLATTLDEAKTLFGTANQLEMTADELEQPVSH